MRPHPIQGTGIRGRRASALLGARVRLALAASLFVLPAFSRAAPPDPTPPSARTAGYGNPRRTPVVDLVDRVKAAVVNIHSERTVMGPAAEELFALAPSQNRINGMGTGILIDQRGYIITNQHVVEDVNLLRIRLADGSAHTARVVARDVETDLALLKIDTTKSLAVMPLGTALDLMVGETVVAVGNAYGYEHSVTCGVVSAIKRDVTLNKEVSYKSLIQTDASINPGNSGGPLLNVNGDLVGVNVAIRAGAQGIGFAIPVDTMIRVSAELLSVRKRNGVWHGLVVRDEVGDGGEIARGSNPARKLVLERLEVNGPASRSGLQRGDVIVQVGDYSIASSLDLERALLDARAGDRVPVVVRRGAAEQRAELVLQATEKAAPAPTDLVWKKLGLRVTPVAAELVSKTNSQLHGGLSVAEVRPESAAGKAGIQRGDILVGLHQWEMLTLDNVVFVLSHPDLATFNPLRFYVVRSGQVHRGWLQHVD
jgi:serine protease Do